jgi:hypothetical protein
VGEHLPVLVSGFPPSRASQESGLTPENLPLPKEYDRLVDGPAARKWLEKERPSLVAARDQAIVELRREKLQKETAEKPHKVARVRR